MKCTIILLLFYRNKLNLKQAINFISRAWNEVTITTIANCWKDTGILPNTEPAAQQIQVDNGEVQALFVDLRKEADSQSMQLADSIKSYCDIVDESLVTKDIMTEKQIIKMVRTEFHPEPEIPDSDEEKEEPPPPCVTAAEALNALHILIQFQEQQPDDKEFKPKELEILRKKYMILKNGKRHKKSKQALFNSLVKKLQICQFECVLLQCNSRQF